MRRQAATIDEVIFDFLWHEADGSAQLDVGQSFLPQVEYGLKADAEVPGNLFGCPQIGIWK
jgi:hypothetical protein